MSDNLRISFCSEKGKIIKALEALENLKKVVLLKNKISRIILEETMAVNWLDIKEMNKYIKKMLPSLKNTLFFNIPNMKFFILEIERKMNEININSPCKYVDFLENILKIKNIDENIRFIKYVLNDNEKCNNVFRKIN